MVIEDEPNLLKISEVAKICGVNSTTVWRWIEKGYIKSIQYPSGSHRINREEIENFLSKVESKKKKYTVMVIDDEQEALDMLRDMLETLEIPLEVKTNIDGLDALVEIGRFKPDLIIIDYKLQDVDGITISTRIMRDNELKSIPIILISGVIDTVPVEELGIAAFLRKPFKMHDLDKAIKGCLAAA